MRPHTFHSIEIAPVLLDTIRQNSIDYSEYFTYTDFRTLVRLRWMRKGNGTMEHNENDVINKIRASKNPERAMQIATEVILDYLMQRESSQLQSAVPLPEPYGAI